MSKHTSSTLIAPIASTSRATALVWAEFAQGGELLYAEAIESQKADAHALIMRLREMGRRIQSDTDATDEAGIFPGEISEAISQLEDLFGEPAE